MKSKPKSFDEALAAMNADQRGAFKKLCKTIEAVAPDAEKCLCYGLAAFRLNGKPLAGFGASKNHCSYFPMSGSVVAMFLDDLTKYETSKGTIRFQADKPLPAALVRKLVKARIAEIEG